MAMQEVEEDRPYVTTFAGDLLVTADNEGDAYNRAGTWATQNLTETAAVPEGTVITQQSDGRWRVPIIGTMNFIGPSQEAVDEKVARHIELPRHMADALDRNIEMGHFYLHSGGVPR